MPIAPQLAARKITLEFTEDGEDYIIQYRPFGQELLDQLTALGDDDADPKERARGIFTGLKQVMTDWNMWEDPEMTRKTPITDEGLMTVHLDILNMIWGKINEDMSVGKRSGKGSRAPLRRVV